MSHEAMREQLQNWVKTAGNDALQAAFEMFVQQGTAPAPYTPEELAQWEADHQAFARGELKTYTREDARAYTHQRLRDAGL